MSNIVLAYKHDVNMIRTLTSRIVQHFEAPSIICSLPINRCSHAITIQRSTLYR